MLEYLLFRAGLFHLEKKNLCRFGICERHFEYLTATDRKDYCKACKPVFNRSTSFNNSLQFVSKSVAFRIWKKGYPEHTWALYGRPICPSCRKHFGTSDDTEDASSETDQIFSECSKYISHFSAVSQ